MAREAYISGYEDLEALRTRFEEFRSRHEKRTGCLKIYGARHRRLLDGAA